MAPKTNFLLNAFSFYITTNKKHADPVVNSQIPDNLSSSHCHTAKVRTTSNVSFESSFAALQNGHQFFTVVLNLGKIKLVFQNPPFFISPRLNMFFVGRGG